MVLSHRERHSRGQVAAVVAVHCDIGAGAGCAVAGTRAAKSACIAAMEWGGGGVPLEAGRSM